MDVGLDLFSFDFNHNQKEMFSDDVVKEKFKTLQNISKDSMNGYFIGIKELPNNMALYIDKFIENGWIEKRGDHGICISDKHLKYHTVDELIDLFETTMESISNKPNVSWYQDIVSVINFSSSPIRWLEDRKEEFERRKRSIVIKYALKYGLKHFKEVPSSRGHKIGSINKWAKENILPVIVDDVLKLTTFEQVEKYFEDNCFFFGRNDWDKKSYDDNYQIPPYPLYWKIIPTLFSIACLVQAETAEDIKLILEYAGRSGGSIVEENCNIIYPKGWSYERYKNSLTDKDKELLRKDRERLKRLHGRDY